MHRVVNVDDRSKYTAPNKAYLTHGGCNFFFSFLFPRKPLEWFGNEIFLVVHSQIGTIME